MEKPTSSASSHRLPTVSATQALSRLQAQTSCAIPTQLRQLDRLLATSRPLKGELKLACHEGLERGKVTEVWGPPGAGKTSFAMQAAVGTLSIGSSVVWIDTAAQRAKPRFDAYLKASVASHDHSEESVQFKSFFAATFAHLLALLLHTPTNLIPSNTALLVIDGMHTVFDIAYPRYRSGGYTNKTDAAKWVAGRRYSVLSSTIAALKRLAALHDMAIIVTTGCATRVRNGSGMGAVLVPGLSSADWESGIANRLVVLRDFSSHPRQPWRKQDGCISRSSRFIALQKVNGMRLGEDGELCEPVAFDIADSGVEEIVHTPSAATTTPSAIIGCPSIKGRKRQHNEIENYDAEDVGSEYGWLDADAEGLMDAAALNEEDPSQGVPR